jgi:flagellar motor switch protein FliN
LSSETESIDPASPRIAEPSAPAAPVADAGPLGSLPRVERKQLRVERVVTRWNAGNRLPAALRWLEEWTCAEIAVLGPEILWRASGLNRTGLVAHLSAPQLATRMALGVEIPLAHAVVDRLLGFNRSMGESRLQLTPVEWGIWTFLILRMLDALEPTVTSERLAAPSDLAVLDRTALVLDRAGPDPFDPEGLGPIVTIRWPVRVANVTGTVRLWLPESMVLSWMSAAALPCPGPEGSRHSPAGLHGRAESSGGAPDRIGALSSQWRALAGQVSLPQGLGGLRSGAVLPLASGGLSGTAANPVGAISLVVDLNAQAARFRIVTRPVPDSGARLLQVETRPILESQPFEPTFGNLKERPVMSPTSPAPDRPGPAGAAGAAAAPLDVPVTLSVELGRVSLTLAQLADLKPGDVVELSRHSRAPVELTSGGRLVARGELILIDTELGVRVTSVFL